MDARDLLLATSGDARTLLDTAQDGWAVAIPDCPEWDAAELTRHLGTIFLWMSATVTAGDRADRSRLGPVPEEPSALPAWYLAALERVLGVLGGADPDAETWTFSAAGDRRVSWWWRRLPVETAIHRWDAQQAVAATGGAPPEPLNGELAAAGIEEFLVEFLPGLLDRPGLRGLGSSLHLHATDGPSEWWVDLGARGPARPGHAKADTAVRASRSDLLLFLWNRTPEHLEVLGDRSVLADWRQLSR